MSDTISRRSMMTSPPLVMMMLVGICAADRGAAMCCWRGADWGAFVWLAVSVARSRFARPIWYATTIKSSSAARIDSSSGCLPECVWPGWCCRSSI